MKAKTFGTIQAVASPIIGVAAYGLYLSGRPIFALIFGAIALAWAGLAVINFRTARRTKQAWTTRTLIQR